MPGHPPREWFSRILPNLRKEYPQLGPTRLNRIASGIWRTTQPTKYLYDPKTGKRKRRFDPKEKTTAKAANYIEPGPYPFVCGNCKFIEWGGKGTRNDSCQLVNGPHKQGMISANGSCRLFQAKPQAGLGPKEGNPTFDPAKLPKPHDYPGIDNLNNLRLVPTAKAPGYHAVKGLMEAQLELPQHQFDRVLKDVTSHPEYSDVEFETEGSKVVRMVRRGKANSATNIFIDRAP
jgi:hypothetical protein